MVKVIKSSTSSIPQDAQILSINNHTIEDFLEYKFYNDPTKMRRILFIHKGKEKLITLAPEQEIAIELETPLYKSCENNCSFCFINGLPPGLRKTLYFKDDDYRLSFLFGNFISLTNLNDHELKRISRLKLSPLYVSVHSTDPGLRIKIFQNKRAGLIMEQLSKLIANQIKLHCQIVVVPGLNDRGSLNQSIKTLAQLYPGVQSIGVVPVGITKYQRHIPQVSPAQAREIIGQVQTLHSSLRKKYQRGIVYCADELYIKARQPIPDSSYYDDFPQLENGIGMMRQFINQFNRTKIRIKLSKKILLLTGMLAYPFILQFKEKLEQLSPGNKGLIEVKPVTNTLFGKTVNVSGLIGASDFKQIINNAGQEYDKIMLPPNCVNEQGAFIDDQTIDAQNVFIAPPTMEELIKCLQ